MLWFTARNNDLGEETLTVLDSHGASIGTIFKTHPNYQTVMDYLHDGGDNPDRLALLMNPDEKILDVRLKVTLADIERVSVHHGWVFIDGEKAPYFLAHHLKKKIQRGDSDYGRVLRFWDKYRNLPSEDQEAISGRDICLDERGHLVDLHAFVSSGANTAVLVSIAPECFSLAREHMGSAVWEDIKEPHSFDTERHPCRAEGFALDEVVKVDTLPGEDFRGMTEINILASSPRLAGVGGGNF